MASHVRPKHWDRLQPRLENNIQATLELLASGDAKATFFVLGCIADQQPRIVAQIVDAGHEVACSGYWPRGLSEMVPDEFREDIRRSKAALERAGANPIVGFRAARWLRQHQLWALQILADEGFVYDSSINPILRRFPNDPVLYEVNRHRLGASDLHIWEFPIATVGMCGLRVAISGGNYMRQFPHTLLRQATAWWHRNRETPMVFYFMPWELDGKQPKISGISRLARLRHYRNLEKSHWIYQYYFQRYRFQSIGDHLGIDYRHEPHKTITEAAVQPTHLILTNDTESRQDVSIVVPLYNEEENISYLRRTLADVRHRLENRYNVFLVLVDDGSEDETWALLEKQFADAVYIQLIRQPQNKGVAAAIDAGIHASRTELVCSMDCDCSYDPTVLEDMLPLIEEAELVTASPYHPEGTVLNVPAWRLFLSRTLSQIYSVLLRDRTHTYTSCFRVYRRSWVLQLGSRSPDFVGIAEMLIQTKLAGGRVVEFPTTLEARLLGVSKMRTMQSIAKHLGLLWRLTLKRTEFETKPVVDAKEPGT